jgi:hypothetical protein
LPLHTFLTSVIPLYSTPTSPRVGQSCTYLCVLSHLSYLYVALCLIPQDIHRARPDISKSKQKHGRGMQAQEQPLDVLFCSTPQPIGTNTWRGNPEGRAGMQHNARQNKYK